MSAYPVVILTACLLGAPATPDPSTVLAWAADRAAALQRALSSFDAAIAAGATHPGEANDRLRQALADFESLVASGVRNGRLFYNIANTNVRLNQVGKAIVNYRRALRLMPADARIKKNLQFARSRVELQISRPATSAFLETLLFWHYGTSLAARTTTLCVSYTLLWGLLVLWRMRRPSPPALRSLIVTVALFTLVIGTSVGWQRVHDADHSQGVTIADDVVLRKGNSVHYEPQLNRSLPQGVEFELIESRPDAEGATWHRIQLPDGKEGWLRGDQAEII